jgi:hypothetical protein
VRDVSARHHLVVNQGDCLDGRTLLAGFRGFGSSLRRYFAGFLIYFGQLDERCPAERLQRERV